MCRVLAQEEIQRFSDLFDTPGEIPQPEEFIKSESGRIYRLKKQELLTVPVVGDTRKLSGQADYPGISRLDTVPDTAVMTVKDEESGKEFEAELSLEQVQYSNERWQAGISFTATFHDYGADYYLFGDIHIPRQTDTPELSSFQGEFLKAAGMEPEDYRIEAFLWDGEPYEDEGGVICRDVLILGRQKVWDCTALYSAAVKMPDFKRYRMSMVYGEAADGGEEKEEGAVPEDGDIPDGETEPGALDKWTEFLKIIKRGLQVSVGIFATAAAALILFWLVKKAGRAGEDDR